MRRSYYIVEFQKEVRIKEFQLEITTTGQGMIALMIPFQMTMVSQL